MKILQATEYFLPDAGRDIERFVFELSRVLSEAGQSVTMLTGGQGRDLKLRGVRIEHASARISSMQRPSARHITSVNSPTMAMHRQRPDVVHAHHFGSGYAAALLKNRLFRGFRVINLRIIHRRCPILNFIYDPLLKSVFFICFLEYENCKPNQQRAIIIIKRYNIFSNLSS